MADFSRDGRNHRAEEDCPGHRPSHCLCKGYTRFPNDPKALCALVGIAIALLPCAMLRTLLLIALIPACTGSHYGKPSLTAKSVDGGTATMWLNPFPNVVVIAW